MRKLTKKQIKILDFHKHINNVNDLPNDVWEELEQINNTEILYNEVDNYLQMNFDCDAPIKKWGKNQLCLNF